MLGKIPFGYNSFTLNDTSASSWAALQKVTGIHELQLRHTRRELTGDHGVQDYDTFAGSRTITFEGLLISDSEANMASFIDVFKRAFSIESNPTPINTGTHELTWQDTSEVAKRSMCRVDRAPSVTEDDHGTLYRHFFVSLIADDPRIEGQTINSQTAYLGYPSGALTFPLTFPLTIDSTYVNAVTITNAGNFSASVTITITCPTGYTITDPRIDNITAGTHVEFTGLAMAEGDILTITAGTATFYDASSGITIDATGYLDATSSSIYASSGANVLVFTDSWSDPTDPNYTKNTGSWQYITAAITWRDTWI